MRETLQVSIADLKGTHRGIWIVLFAEKPERADSLIYYMPSSGRQIWVKIEKQWVYRCTYATCCVFCCRLWELCTSIQSLSSPPKHQCSSVIRYKVAGTACVRISPTVCKCTSRSIRNEPQGKESNTFEGWLWSQLIMFPWRSTAMELTMNSPIVLFLPGKQNWHLLLGCFYLKKMFAELFACQVSKRKDYTCNRQKSNTVVIC